MFCTRQSPLGMKSLLSCSCTRAGPSRYLPAEASSSRRLRERLAPRTPSKCPATRRYFHEEALDSSNNLVNRLYSLLEDAPPPLPYVADVVEDAEMFELLNESATRRSPRERAEIEVRFRKMTTLFVGHVHSWARPDQMKNIFDRFGPIKLSWKTYSNGQNATFAIVGFQSNAALRACVHAYLCNRGLFKINDYPLRLDLTTDDRQLPTVIPTDGVHVGGFREPVSEEAIRGVFSKFGEIVSITRHPSWEKIESGEYEGPVTMVPAENDWVHIKFSSIREAMAVVEAQERSRLTVGDSRVWVASQNQESIAVHDFKREKEPTDTLWVGRFVCPEEDTPSAAELAHMMRLEEPVKQIQFNRSRDGLYSYAKITCFSIEQAQDIFDEHKRRPFRMDQRTLVVDWSHQAAPREPSTLLCIPGFNGDRVELKRGFGNLEPYILRIDTPQGRLQWGAYVEFDTLEHAEEAMRRCSTLPFRNSHGQIIRPVYAVQRERWSDLLNDRQDSEADERDLNDSMWGLRTNSEAATWGQKESEDAAFGLKDSGASLRKRSISYGSDWGGSQNSPEYKVNKGFLTTLPKPMD
ncbi:hypothetical protein CERSUDRAFT_116671 [Gelatoporia subvermispora B]|uniref:RRM domain-containing protein n=1 Tax=Ceriporiopsis subvermispora (strain B) TaxID=914234 RepID=M2QDS9_CERS8|nr:hypothetical protein CERSUDRAFT_116671 [Gelatoporia subvermispora B]